MARTRRLVGAEHPRESPDTVRRRYRLLGLLREYERLPLGDERDAVLAKMKRVVRTADTYIALMEARVARERIASDNMGSMLRRALVPKQPDAAEGDGSRNDTSADEIVEVDEPDDVSAPPKGARSRPRGSDIAVEADAKHAPRDLPDLRSQMVQFWDSAPALRWLDLVASMNDSAYDPAEKPDIARLVRESLARAELFHLGRPLSRVVDRQPVDMHEYGFMPWDLPSPHGVLYLSEVQLDVDYEPPMPGLLSWTTIDDLEGWPHGALDVFIHMDKDALRDSLEGSIGDRFEQELPPFVLTGVFTVGFAERGEEILVQGQELRVQTFTPRLFSACHLMRQHDLVDDYPEQLPRPQRRRAERLGLDPRATRVINLRQAERPGSTGESEAEWHHRWIVRGHWRRQWYPREEVHRPKWINPFVKGKAGAPLLTGDKVHQATIRERSS